MRKSDHVGLSVVRLKPIGYRMFKPVSFLEKDKTIFPMHRLVCFEMTSDSVDDCRRDLPNDEPSHAHEQPSQARTTLFPQVPPAEPTLGCVRIPFALVGLEYIPSWNTEALFH